MPHVSWLQKVVLNYKRETIKWKVLKKKDLIKKTVGILLIGIVLLGLLYTEYIVLERVLKQPDDLIELQGVITSSQKFKTDHYRRPKNAYAITIGSESLKFAISENDPRAYHFIDNNPVLGKRVKLFYDKEGYNSSDSLTYHVYFLQIEGKTILTISESKRIDKIGISILFAFNIFLIWFFLKARNEMKLMKNS